MTHHIEPVKTYAAVFIALLVLVGATVAIAEVDLGEWNIIAALVIAFIKTILVVWFFMHVRHTGALTRLFVVGGLFWLAIFFTLVFSDYITRTWSTYGRT